MTETERILQELLWAIRAITAKIEAITAKFDENTEKITLKEIKARLRDPMDR